MNPYFSLFFLATWVCCQANAAEEQKIPNSGGGGFHCPIPVNSDGTISVDRMVRALSACEMGNPKFASANLLRPEIIDFGIYEFRYQAAGDDDPSLGNEIVGFDHVSWETDLKLEIGLLFGFRVNLTGVPDNTTEEIDIHYIYPARGQNGLPAIVENVISKEIRNNNNEFVSYYLETTQEMVAGEWIFEVRYQGQVIAIKRFNLH